MKILKFILRIFALLGLSYVPFVMTLAILSDFGIIDKTLNTIPLFFIVFGVLLTIDIYKNFPYNRVLKLINSFRGRHKGASKTKLA